MSTVVGIDLGIKKIAWSVWEDDVLVDTGAFSSSELTRPMDLEAISTQIEAVVSSHFPSSIFIEETLIGNNRKYSIQLSQTMGAVMAALAYVAPIYLVNVSTWKKEVIGNGNSDKKAIRDYVLSRDSAYAALCGSDQDQYDAACIGYYGVLISERAELLADPR